MRKTIFILSVIAVMCLAGLAYAADQHVITDLELHPDNEVKGDASILQDAEGNVHMLFTAEAETTTGDRDGWGEEPNIIYYMVAPDGDVLIADTWLTCGGDGNTDKNKARLAWYGPTPGE